MKADSRLQSHWIGALFLVPFLIMLWIHHALGLSDAFLLVGDQRDRDSQVFNLFMGSVFYVGVGLFSAHALSLLAKGWRWVILKLLVAAVNEGIGSLQSSPCMPNREESLFFRATGIFAAF